MGSESPFPKTFGKFSRRRRCWSCGKVVLYFSKQRWEKQRSVIAFSIAAAASTTLPAPDHPLQSRNSHDLYRFDSSVLCKRITDISIGPLQRQISNTQF